MSHTRTVQVTSVWTSAARPWLRERERQEDAAVSILLTHSVCLLWVRLREEECVLVGGLRRVEGAMLSHTHSSLFHITSRLLSFPVHSTLLLLPLFSHSLFFSLLNCHFQCFLSSSLHFLSSSLISITTLYINLARFLNKFPKNCRRFKSIHSCCMNISSWVKPASG